MADAPKQAASSPHRPLPAFIETDGTHVRLAVRVIPRAGRTALAGERAGALLVRLAAAPVDGAANDALLEFLAECLDVPARTLTLVSGQKSRDKRIAVASLPVATVATRLLTKMAE